MKFDGLSALLLPFLTATTWFPHAVAAGDALSTYQACRLALGAVHFDDLGPSPPKLNETCQSRLSIDSHYLCLKVYGPDNADWSASLGPQNETCQLYLDTSLPPFSVVDDYSDERISQLKRVGLEDREAGHVWGEVVLVSERLYHAASGTLVSLTREPMGLQLVLRKSGLEVANVDRTPLIMSTAITMLTGRPPT